MSNYDRLVDSEAVPYEPTSAPFSTEFYPQPPMVFGDDDSKEANMNDESPPAPALPYDCRNQWHSNRSGSSIGWRRRQIIKCGKTRKVKLTSGNFIAEYAVPTPISYAVPAKYISSNSNEFTHLRYSAATCDPDDFTRENGWTLRTSNMNRPTELLIAVTSYNEPKLLHIRTLHSLMINIRNITLSKTSRYWRRSSEDGIPGWQRIVVALLVDGLDTMDKGALDPLATIGVYQDGLMKKQVDGKDVTAHIFEYTTILSIDDTPQLCLPQGDDPNNFVPVQIVFVLKSKNQKKLNSHRWLFNGIAQHLDPEICVLVDVGTKLAPKALYHLWKAFYNNPNLGGACGEIQVMTKGGKKLINPLVAAQNFEYKMMAILDKTLETSFGYAPVLPGAFSAYRFRAIQGRPLERYFHGDPTMAHRLGKKGILGMNVFTKNMFLAEDRVIAFELFAKQNCSWVLQYVERSKADTDIPETAVDLLAQRRRWMNSAFAASVYSIRYFFRIYQSGHGIIRIAFFHVQTLYNLFSLIFSWFALANHWLAFAIIIELLPARGFYAFGTPYATRLVHAILNWAYIGCLASQFVLGLGTRPKHQRFSYEFALWFYAVLSAYLIICSSILVIKSIQGVQLAETATTITTLDRLKLLLSGASGTLGGAALATFAVYFLASLLALDPWPMLTCTFQYLFLAPSFSNVLNTYAFCNLHNTSWGTKGSDAVEVLKSVNSNKDEGVAVIIDEEYLQADINAAFKETVTRATKRDEEKAQITQPTIEDENEAVRAYLVSAWVLSNALLAVLVQTLAGPRSEHGIGLAEDAATVTQPQAIYLMTIIWTTFGFAAFRFLGSVFYFLRWGPLSQLYARD